MFPRCLWGKGGGGAKGGTSLIYTGEPLRRCGELEHRQGGQGNSSDNSCKGGCQVQGVKGDNHNAALFVSNNGSAALHAWPLMPANCQCISNNVDHMTR